jgi:signal recognition particle receptor subunit beta
MVSLATETDRTLFFDFLPLDLGTIKGFAIKFQLYTVPGQVYYNATRKLVLRGVDGIVFVADSAADKMDENLESFQNMEDNLTEYGYKRETIPIILQYNKRDLPNALPNDEIDKKLNKYNYQWTEGIAVKGNGVFETLKVIGKSVVDQLNKKYASPSKKAAPQKPVQPTRFTKQPAAEQSIFSPTAPPSHLRPTAKIPTQSPQPKPVQPRPAQPGFPPRQPVAPGKPPFTQAPAGKSDLDEEIERYHEKISQKQVQKGPIPQPQPRIQPQPQKAFKPEPLFEPPPKPSSQPSQFTQQPKPDLVQPYAQKQEQSQTGPKPAGAPTPPSGIEAVKPESIPRPRDFSAKSDSKKPMYFTTMDTDDLGKRERKFGKEEKTKKSFFGKLFKRNSE